MTGTATRNGFTLIEMMVSLFIFALLASAGVALLSFGVRAQAAANTRLDEVAQVRRMSALLANDLAQALPRTSRDKDGTRLPAFTGNDGTSDALVLGFVRGGWGNPDGLMRSGIQRVDISLTDGKLARDGYAVTDGGLAPATLILADRVTALALRYRDRKGEWHPRWDNAALSSTPSAVEMTITRTARPPLTLAFVVGTSYP